MWAEKTGLLVPDVDTAVTERGRRLEPVVADMVREAKPEWRIWKNEHYLREKSSRFGATPDYWYEPTPGVLGVLQIKTTSPQQFQDGWLEGSPPLWIVLQTLSEMMLGAAQVGAVAVLVFDQWTFDLHIFEVQRHATAEAKIIQAIEAFWNETDRGNQPPFIPGRDSALIKSLFPTHTPGEYVQLDAAACGRLARISRIREAIRIGRDQLEEDEDAIRQSIGCAEGGIGVDEAGVEWSCSLRRQDRKEHTVKASSFRPLKIKRIDPNGPAD